VCGQKTKKTEHRKDIPTNNVKVCISKDEAMLVAGIALQHLCVSLGHVLITHDIVGNNTPPINWHICQHSKYGHRVTYYAIQMLFNVLSIVEIVSSRKFVSNVTTGLRKTIKNTLNSYYETLTKSCM